MNNFVCKECCKELGMADFYYRKDGSRISKCKDCYTQSVDDYRPTTFLSLMEDIDIPFIIEEWISLRDHIEENKSCYARKTIFGKYLNLMKCANFKNFSYADSNLLNYNYHLLKEIQKQKEEEVIYNAQIILRKM